MTTPRESPPGSVDRPDAPALPAAQAPRSPAGRNPDNGSILMPVDIDIDVARNLIRCVVHGSLSPAELTSVFLTMIERADFKPGMNVLYDFTDGVTAELSSENMREHVKTVAAHQQQRGENYRVAILAPRDLDFGMFRVYQALADELPLHIRVVRTREEADAWLRVKTSE